ncbi:uncharacterized protein LOC117105005 isoform X2 [Anneissia japonica]|uniref:uncharacterized protein LOC117105005 isoform X2 n=1 Tax=Anneissia japonica TaxID=1529436 RepID=UPI0014254C16|nr:uncharacterized protein LOC117105005 isoform X2 [Anneissia japonica]
MSDNWSVKQRLRENVIESVLNGDRSNVEKYLNEGADVDESQGGYMTKKTLLMLAIENNHEEIARMLISRGADLTCSVTVDKTEKTAVELANEKELNSLAQLIEQTVSANKELLAAAKVDNVQDAEAAITKGANINGKYTDPDQSDMPNASALMLTICFKSINVAKLLIEKGADVTYAIQCEDKSGGDTIHTTARTLSVNMDLNEVTQLIDASLTKSKENETSDTQNSVDNTKENKESETPKEPCQTEGDLVDFDDSDWQNTNESKNKRVQKSGSVCIII